MLEAGLLPFGSQSPQSPSATGEATISASHPSGLDQLKSAIPVLGHLSDLLSGRAPLMAPMPLKDVTQLMYPERVFSESEREKHPIRTGFDEFAGSLTSPDNLLMMKGLGALGLAPKSLGKVLPRLASALFAGQMGWAALNEMDGAVEHWQKYKKTGDEKEKNEALRQGTHAFFTGLMTMFSAKHAWEGLPAETRSQLSRCMMALRRC